MINKREVFLVDANIFIAPFKYYYAFDIVPAFWKQLRPHLESGRVVVLDVVKDEIVKGQDDLSNWLLEVDKLVVIPRATRETIIGYQEVMRYVADSGYYKESALNSWAPSDVADPWLIASAKANGFTLVTQEVASGGLSKKNPNKDAKIPDVARFFEVRTISIYEMMRKLGIKID